MRLRPLHWVLISVVLAIAAGVVWRPKPAAQLPAAPAAPKPGEGVALDAAQVANLGIRTEPARRADRVPVTGLPAEAVPPLAASTQVAVPFAGVVTRVLVDEGERVRRGQPLLRMQSRELIAVQAELARARAEAGVAAQQARRDALLAREGIIPASRPAESAARSAAAAASVGEASAMLSQLRRVPGGMPGESDVLAPQSGRVLRRNATPGQALEAMAPAFVIAEGDALDIHFSAPIALRAQLQPGLQVRLPDGGDARIVAVGADTDALSQSLRVRARAEAAAALVPGQQFEVTLDLPAPPDAVVVPASALLPHGEAHVLYVLEQGRYHGRVVRLLGRDDAVAVVAGGGLGERSTVVAAGTSVLKSLAPVE